MKVLKGLIVVLVLLVVLVLVAKSIIQVDVSEDVLPTSVYEEDTDLLTLVNTKLLGLFTTTVTSEYTIVEEVVNLIIIDSIRDNVNSDYDPLGDCDTTDCNFIIYDENYYVNYIWAELSDDDQLIIHVSLGSERSIGVNTTFDFYFDIDIDYLGFGIELTLDTYYISDKNLSTDILDKIFSNLDIDEIESQVSKGELDLEEYSYKISFNPLS
ncbi:MAG: hypothetical protein KAJ22_02725 [Candidatus Izimaplasma sp.]|nr:hypothetical protein [Candidatus Izimaplasma bacterium]